MLFDRKVFYIEEGKLSKALGLEQREFDEIVNSLEASTDENVRLKEWLHFVVQGYINKQQPIRIFSREGAIAVASYLDSHGETTEILVKRVLSLLKRYRRGIARCFVSIVLDKQHMMDGEMVILDAVPAPSLCCNH